MTPDGFDATFRLTIDRSLAWQRLTEQLGWLPGFDAQVEVVETDDGSRLRATKVDEPCAGTDIVVTLEDDETGTRVRVVQSRFGDWLASGYEVMSVGWRFIVADLQTYLATGVHARRHLSRWGDLGARASAVDGGVRVSHIQPAGLAARSGLADGDLLVRLAGAPVATLDDLVTILRVVEPTPDAISAAWIRDGELLTTRV